MQCPTCDAYGDLVRARVRKTGQEVIVCTECDLLWPHADRHIDAARATDVASFLAQAGLDGEWQELDIIARLPAA
ncbi:MULTISPECIES: hypothetical protein [unclassified Janthinobacterium]|uniref:hypothetical protein n=1 Tax=unclassified Janthinobacterium TaxID=2610881 RepID=UPI0012EB8F0E|nr:MULTISPECIES: hypothetical protein [unclassified Janthinobacterium]MDN2712159.1 hypothetical protein [Janthinobacterium sp. SUN118]